MAYYSHHRPMSKRSSVLPGAGAELLALTTRTPSEIANYGGTGAMGALAGGLLGALGGGLVEEFKHPEEEKKREYFKQMLRGGLIGGGLGLVGLPALRAYAAADNPAFYEMLRAKQLSRLL